MTKQKHHDRAAAFQQALHQLAPSFGLNMNDALAKALSDHYIAMLKWNKVAHLTSVVDPYEAARIHYLESLYASQFIQPQLESLVDIGSGPGFPGIVLATIRPTLKVVLIESQSRKASFLKNISRELGLSNIAVFHGRFQEYQNQCFDLVSCRAIDKMATILPEIFLFAKACYQILFFSGNELFYKCLDLFKENWDATRYKIPLSRNRWIISLLKIVPRETNTNCGGKTHVHGAQKPAET
ncbi:MAG: 16S rRNA (guanine(527)-N(7))-methyltransferase RsmG [Acidobacteriota bacterium]|nr:16S rRNA (guanine(527)-N(7))-methyltransferase RsmG [Blastocatellia bacterium]MDW8238356.1 16S rRNA (guanine(527)-N(7))-methyltransferase RsmG [Acidobacteriota bacterium]